MDFKKSNKLQFVGKTDKLKFAGQFYLFENWNLARAPFWPYFLRSF